MATTLPTHGGRIRKPAIGGVVAPNLADYDAVGETFTWEQARRALDGLPGSGLLVEDPADVAAFGDAIVVLLREPSLAARLGQTGRKRVRALYLNDLRFMRWVEVFGSALERRVTATRPEGPAGGEPDQERSMPESSILPITTI